MDTRTAQSVTAHRTQRNLRGWRWGVVGLAAVLAAGGAVGASAQPAGAPSAATPGVGTIPPLPPPPAQNQAAVVTGAGSTAKAKVAFPLPVQIQRVYASVKTVFGDNTLTTISNAYVLQAPGPDPVYGIFPDTRVTVLGFGALPVTATIHLTQTTDATGTLNPLVIYNFSKTTFPPDQPSGVVSGFTRVSGQVLIRLSDVTIDTVPLDVGPDCVGSAPIDLVLHGTDKPGRRRTDYTPFTGGPLAGTFAIPTFTGCGAGGQDLDPLFNGTVSGPNNAIVLNQGPLGEWDPTQSNDCRISNTDPPTSCATPPAPPLPTPTGS